MSEAVKEKGGKTKTKKVRTDGTIEIEAGVANKLAKIIEERTGIETRATVLGAMQRGCAPNARDRLIASAFGAKAVKAVAEGKNNVMVSWKSGEVKAVDLNTGIGTAGSVDTKGLRIRTAKCLNICLGDE